MIAERQYEQVYVALVRRLNSLHHTMQVLGENEMGLLQEHMAGRFHGITDALGQLVHDLTQDALWPHEPGQGLD